MLGVTTGEGGKQIRKGQIKKKKRKKRVPIISINKSFSLVFLSYFILMLSI